MGRRGRGKRYISMGLLAAVLIAGGLLFAWTLRPQWQPLDISPLAAVPYVQTSGGRQDWESPQRIAAVRDFLSSLSVRPSAHGPDGATALALHLQGAVPSSVDIALFPMGYIAIDGDGVARLDFGGYGSGYWLIRDFDYAGYRRLCEWLESKDQ